MKSISNNSFINQAIDFFTQRLVPTLSALLTKIKAIAVAAFTMIADCFRGQQPKPNNRELILHPPGFHTPDTTAPVNNGTNPMIINENDEKSSRIQIYKSQKIRQIHH